MMGRRASSRARRSLALAFLFVGTFAGARSVDPPAAREGGGVAGRISILRPETPEDALRQFLLLNRYAVAKSLGADAMATVAGGTMIPLSEKAVVYLESPVFAKMSFPPPARRPALNQKNLMFRPQVLPILVGTTVDFPNNDNIFHNVFSYSAPREFDLGRYPKGESRPVRFDETGVVRVYCDIHAHMNATILVLDNPYFATPAADGTYEIQNVPEGDYTIHFWYGRALVESRRISVRSGTITNADFRY